MKAGLSHVVAAALLLGGARNAARATGRAIPAALRSSAPVPPASVPFAVGERLDYDVRFGRIHVGSGDMEVLPMDTVRGHDAWHTVFHLSGGIPFYHVNDQYESWFDAHTLSSLRYWQLIDEGSYDPKRRYEIFPDRREYTENDKPPAASVSHPLDDGSFVYFLRTIPLRVGLDTSFDNYFIADRNPVRIRVLAKEHISVPAGEFDAFVIQPIINAKGIFGQGGDARIWLSDDSTRIMLQMKSKVSFGSLDLYLKSYRPPTQSSPAPPSAPASR